MGMVFPFLLISDYVEVQLLSYYVHGARSHAIIPPRRAFTKGG
jgi:hypothetical protein